MSSAQIIHLALLGTFLIVISRKLPRFSLGRPVTFAMIVCAIVLFGIAALVQLPVELMPNVSYGNVTIFVDVRGGMPPPEIERLIVKPIEEVMGTVSKVRNLISSSKKDRAIVTLEFEPGTDMDLATLEVREKFLRVKPKLPTEIEKPIIARYEESDAPIYIAALTSEIYTPEELRQMVDLGIKEELMRIDGVANIEVGGGRQRKIIVDIDRDRLAAFGLPIKKVVGVLEQNNLNLRIGEVKGTETLSFGVRTVGAFRTIEDIRNIAVAVSKNRSRIRLKDIADVKDSFLEMESYSRLNAKAAVTLYVQKETTANTVKTVAHVEKRMQQFRAKLPKGIEIVSISNQRTAILSAIDSVRMTLLYGVALVILVLPVFLAKTRLTRAVTGGLLLILVFNVLFFYFMRWPLDHTGWLVAIVILSIVIYSFYHQDIRTAFVVAISIPTSVCVTFALMFFEKISINVMSLSGLILGIGLLVDNAIVVVENYDRILSHNPGIPLQNAVLKAADEMVPSIVGGTLTTVVVFLPFSLFQKQTQLLFSGISFTVTASLLSSLFIALTLVPALVCRIDPTKWKGTVWDDVLKKQQDRIMNWLKLKIQTPPISERFFDQMSLRATEGSVAISKDETSTTISKAKQNGIASSQTPRNDDMRQNFSRFDNHMLKIYLHFSLYAFIRNRKFVFGGILIFSIVTAIHFVFKLDWIVSFFVLCSGILVMGGLIMVLKYVLTLPLCVNHKKWMFGIASSIFLFALIVFIFKLPKDFMASSEQNEFIIFVELDTGVRLDISNKVVEEVERIVRDFQPTRSAIKNVSSRVEGWSSKIYVTLNDLSKRQMSTQEVIKILRPEVDRVVEKYAKDYQAFDYFSEPQTGKEIFVEIYGYEYDLMAKLAMEVGSRMGKYSGFSDVKIRYRPGRPQLSVIIDPLRATLFGLDTKEIADTLHAQMRGLRATTFFNQAQEIETVVRVKPEQRETVEQLKNLMIVAPHGGQVPLDQVCTIEGDLSPSEIWHRNKARMIQVSANLGNTSLATAAKVVKRIFGEISFPQEYYGDIGGQYEDMMTANRDFWKAFILTIFLVFMVMACQFESYSLPLVIMGTVPLSAIGAIAVLSVFKTPVTLGVSVGLLMLGGIEVNKGIMLIDRINILRKNYPAQELSATVLQAGMQRIRPIFMTTVTTVLGLVPMALDRSESASLWSPLAMTVIGGLISSTILTLFIVPCLYLSVVGLKKNLTQSLSK